MDVVRNEGFFEKFREQSFIPGVSTIPFALQYLGEQEFENLLDVLLSQRFVGGKYTQTFEKEFASFCMRDHSIFVNSGSSANLLALASLSSPKLGPNKLERGDEIITVAAGFPTTVNPIVQYGLTPIFIDIELGSYNIDTSLIEEAITPRTKGIMLAHTLGNPFNLKEIIRIKDKYDLYLIEDCCDALGSRYQGQLVGTFGDIATYSFYPAHHMTTAEGGAVLSNNGLIARIIRSFRDWGRDCWCRPGQDNTCGHRFTQQHGNLPSGYDHKYTYSHLGYNLKATEFQAAIGLAQLQKVNSFIDARKKNFNLMESALSDLEEFFILPYPTEESEPSWFAFPLTIREDAPFKRQKIINFLESKGIMTRMLFGGNLTRHPAYQHVNYRIPKPLTNTDIVMKNFFFLGLHPLLLEEHIEFILDCIKEFVFSSKRIEGR
jgi:CDP-6-deoxy-D-xylo-4-hexulose-3-dehydrase